MIELLSMPFVQIALMTAFVLAGIHTYLGFHIVSRGVIFIDLSLAQAAAFGTATALAVGLEDNPLLRYLMALLFTFIGAIIISFTRTKDERVPQEAFIGIVYAAFTAGTVLLLARRAEGMGELSHLISGSLLTVSTPELLKITIIYAIIGILHYILKHRFLTISTDREKAVKLGWKTGWWDFLFYALFGVVVTSSVAVAGVMLVFSLLVIPPVAALLISKRHNLRLILGWTVGFMGAAIGVLIALKFDFPVGPSIIVSLVGILVSVVVIRVIKRLSA
ncbi:MAG: metal ABC transporter permease [Candidatus Marinimicrobia bacterium]|nr:metal ABC transporter permease [Candidatus Neomarinimicrobiota bacterium]